MPIQTMNLNGLRSKMCGLIGPAIISRDHFLKHAELNHIDDVPGLIAAESVSFEGKEDDTNHHFRDSLQAGALENRVHRRYITKYYQLSCQLPMLHVCFLRRNANALFIRSSAESD